MTGEARRCPGVFARVFCYIDMVAFFLESNERGNACRRGRWHMVSRFRSLKKMLGGGWGSLDKRQRDR
jgi:hypothetical protein